ARALVEASGSAASGPPHRSDPFADAGTETYLRSRLRWLKLRILIQIWVAGHRVDALIGDRLVLQIDGKHHVGAQRSEDIRHDAELRLMRCDIWSEGSAFLRGKCTGETPRSPGADAAYNVGNSFDPAITGELSEEPFDTPSASSA